MKRLMAHMALVRLLIGVRFLMRYQRGNTIERLLAQLADIGPVGRMYGAVLRQCRHLTEGLVTHATSVFTFVGMRGQMAHQRVLVAEFFWTWKELLILSLQLRSFRIQTESDNVAHVNKHPYCYWPTFDRYCILQNQNNYVGLVMSNAKLKQLCVTQ